jgi:hypothetical protein
MRFYLYVALMSIWLSCSCSVAVAQTNEECPQGCFYDDTWPDDTGVYATTAQVPTTSSNQYFNVALTLLGPSGNTNTQQINCRASQGVDAWLGWPGNNFGTYQATANYQAYYDLSYDRIYGCIYLNPAKLIPQIFTATVGPRITFYQNPVVVTILGVGEAVAYTDLACNPGTNATCVSGGDI